MLNFQQHSFISGNSPFTFKNKANYSSDPAFGSKVIISGGGTTELLDDVRVTDGNEKEIPKSQMKDFVDKIRSAVVDGTTINQNKLEEMLGALKLKYRSITMTNFSNGSLARALSEEAKKRNHDVTLVAPKKLPSLTGGPLSEGIDHRPFKSTADLGKELDKASKEGFDIVFQTAAVSDYAPKKAEGKISSNKDILEVQYERNPKLLKGLRDSFGREAFIVGFKLLSGASEQELYKAAVEQMRENRTNLCIANLYSDVGGGQHKALIITPEGGKFPISGTKEEAAKQIFDFIEKRFDVKWFQTIQDSTMPQKPESKLPQNILKFAQKSKLLVDHNGNISARLPDSMLAVTPRSVDKSKLEDAMIVARVDQKNRKVYINSPVKASIDTSVSDALYKEYPELNATIHSHTKWGIGGIKTSSPYPCGVKEEAQEIISTMRNADYKDGDPFLVELTHHGYILGLNDKLTLKKLESQWKAINDDFVDHIKKVELDIKDFDLNRIEPVISPEGIVGWVYTHPDDTVSVRLLPEHQGKGYGKELLKILKDNDLAIKTVPKCGAADYYLSHGFVEDPQRRENDMMYLKPNKK